MNNTPNTGPDDLLRASEVAEMLRISVRHLQRLAEKHVLDPIHLPSTRGIRYRRRDVEAFIAGGQHA